MRVDPEARLVAAREGARMLFAAGARRVVLFGSLAKARSQDERSDIDLAVEGLPPDAFYRLVGELNEALGAPVDLVELESAPPALRAAIERDGKDLAR